MIIRKPLDCIVRIIPIESLKRYYKPGEIISYCKHCPRYGLNWSCPPHDFNATDYIARFKLAYAIGIKVSLSGFSQKAEAIGYYQDCRHSINQRLLRYEAQITESVVLIGGHCDLCENCSRQVLMKCHHPDRQRYSFESLGFKVSEIVEDVFDDTLEWDNGNSPDSLYIVAGILSNSTIDAVELRKVITENCDANWGSSFLTGHPGTENKL